MVSASGKQGNPGFAFWFKEENKHIYTFDGRVRNYKKNGNTDGLFIFYRQLIFPDLIGNIYIKNTDLVHKMLGYWFDAGVQ